MNKNLQDQIAQLKLENQFYRGMDILWLFIHIIEQLEKNSIMHLSQICDITEKLKSAEKLEDTRVKLSNLESSFKKFYKEIEEAISWPVTYEVISEPIITPAGITYEKYVIEKCVKDNHRDPITKEKLNRGKLKPNLMVKSVITAFKKYKNLILGTTTDQSDGDLKDEEEQSIKMHNKKSSEETWLN